MPVLVGCVICGLALPASVPTWRLLAQPTSPPPQHPSQSRDVKNSPGISRHCSSLPADPQTRPWPYTRPHYIGSVTDNRTPLLNVRYLARYAGRTMYLYTQGSRNYQASLQQRVFKHNFHLRRQSCASTSPVVYSPTALIWHFLSSKCGTYTSQVASE